MVGYAPPDRGYRHVVGVDEYNALQDAVAAHDEMLPEKADQVALDTANAAIAENATDIAATKPVANGAVAVGNGTGTDLVPADTSGGLFNILNGERHHRAHDAITLAASSSPKWMKDAADYKPDYAGSDSDHLQNAITESQAEAQTPDVKMLPGAYTFNNVNPIDWGACNIIGSGGLVALGVRIFWGGAAGATVFRKTNSGAGQMKGISFRGAVSGGVVPGTWIDFTPINVDKYCRLEDVHLVGTSGPLIKIAQWYNLHWSGLRFDDWGTYAIEAQPSVGPFLDSFEITQFTADTGLTAGQAKGFFHLIWPAAGPSLTGAIVFRNARIEKNAAFAANSALIVTDYQTATGANAGALFGFDGVQFQNNVGGDGVPLFRRNSGGTVGWENATGRNSFLQCSQVGAGDFLDGAAPMPTDADWKVGRQTATTTPVLNVVSTSYVGTPNVFTVKTAGEAQPWLIGTNGKKLTAGPGGGTAPDVNLYRSAADTWKTDDKFITAGGLGVGNSAAATTPGSVVRKIEVFDASGNSLGFIPVYSSIT